MCCAPFVTTQRQLCRMMPGDGGDSLMRAAAASTLQPRQHLLRRQGWHADHPHTLSGCVAYRGAPPLSLAAAKAF
jgi:hypothetical protein